MILEHNKEYNIEKTNYVLVVSAIAGSATLSISIDDLPFVEVPDGAWSEDTAVQIALPSCKLKVALTGDARVAVGDIRSSLR